MIVVSIATVDAVLAQFAGEGFAHAAVIGEMAAGSARIKVSV